MRLLIETTLRNKHALVHGDVSPKNILSRSRGPVFLDAECAWWGDPAFDLAFCLNHLMLKCLWVPAARAALLESFEAMTAAYLPLVAWEPAAALEKRAAHLLPALFLARVDGKSPVEYLTAGRAARRPSASSRAVCLLIRPIASSMWSRPGKRKLPHDRYQHRLYPRSPRLGQPRTTDGGG